MEETASRRLTKHEKKMRSQWLLKYNTQKTTNFEYMFPSRTPDNKNHHYILKLNIDQIEKQIIPERKAVRILNIIT